MFNNTQWKIICIRMSQQKGVLIFSDFLLLSALSFLQENEKFEGFKFKDFHKIMTKN